MNPVQNARSVLDGVAPQLKQWLASEYHAARHVKYLPMHALGLASLSWIPRFAYM